jgi:hypothetical protein
VIFHQPANHAIHRTSGAQYYEVKYLAVGGAPAAADGERSADTTQMGTPWK